MGPEHTVGATWPYVVHFQECKRANSRDRSVTTVGRFDMQMSIKVPATLEDVTQWILCQEEVLLLQKQRKQASSTGL